MNRCWTVVLTYNGLEDTRKCLGSLASHAQRGYPVVLVDNGSTDNTAAIVAVEFPWAHVVRIEQNAGPSVGYNRGIQYALEQSAQFVLLLNNDTTVSPQLADRLLAAAE